MSSELGAHEVQHSLTICRNKTELFITFCIYFYFSLFLEIGSCSFLPQNRYTLVFLNILEADAQENFFPIMGPKK